MTKIAPCPYVQRLIKTLTAHSAMMQILNVLHLIEPSAYLAAGVIRNCIWAHLHGQHYRLDQIEIDIIFSTRRTLAIISNVFKSIL